MIDIEPTPEQREFRILAHLFAEKTVRPAAAEADEREQVPWPGLTAAEENFWGCAGVGTIAEMAMQIDAARLLTWRAAWLADHDRPCTREASLAKAFAADTATKVTTDAVQILGGYGYLRDDPVENTSQLQRLIIARHLVATETS